MSDDASTGDGVAGGQERGDRTTGADAAASGAYTLVAAGAVLAASGGLLVVLADRSLALFGGFALAGAVLALFGASELHGARSGGASRQSSAVQQQSGSAGDPLVRSGHVGFWVLLSVLLLDSAWEVVPAGRVPLAYVYVGCVAVLAAAAYALATESVQ